MLEKLKQFFLWEEDDEPNPLNHAFVEKEPSKRKMRKRINTLEGQVAVLESSIKDELFKVFMEKLGEPQENIRLKEENKRLRRKIKELKEIIKES